MLCNLDHTDHDMKGIPITVSDLFGVSFKDSSPKANTELITEKHLTSTHQKPILSSAQPPGTPGFDQDLNVSKACGGMSLCLHTM